MADRLAQSVKQDSGQAVIETAVSMPLMILLLFGIYSFAIILFGFCNLTFASRAAVRYASLHSLTSLNPATTLSVSAVVTPYLLGSNPGASSTNIVYFPLNTIGSTVQVQVTATYPVVMPFTSFSSFTLASTAQRTITR